MSESVNDAVTSCHGETGKDEVYGPTEFAVEPKGDSLSMLPHVHVNGKCVKNRFGPRCDTEILGTYTLDPNNPFHAVLIQMAEMNAKKRQDYAGGEDPLGNFKDSAAQLRLTPGHSVEQLIATKQARLRTLLPKVWSHNDYSVPVNEPVEDTLLDRAVYSVIALTIWNERGYTNWL